MKLVSRMNFGFKNGFSLFPAIILVLTFFGCSADELEEGKKANRELALPVQVGRVIFKDVVDEVRTVGNLVAEHRVIITSEVDGKVEQIPVEEGGSVKSGQLLAQIDNRQYKLEIGRLRADRISAQKDFEKAQKGLRPEDKEKLEAKVKADQSSLDLAQKEFNRIEQLVRDGVVSQSNLDEAHDRVLRAHETLRSSQAELNAGSSSREEDILKAKSDLESVSKKLALAELNLSKTKIKAPFDGVVISKRIEVGAYVGSGSPIIEMIGSSRLKVVLEIPQRYRGKLNKLNEIEFFVPELNLKFLVNKHLNQNVRVIPDANIYSGNIKVQVDLLNPDEALFPGLTLEGTFRFESRRNIKHVPSISLVISEKGTVVYTVKEDRAQLVPVKAYNEQDNLVEIEDFTHQLTPKTDLILRGSGAVFPGVKVIVTNKEPKAKAPFNAAKKGKSKPPRDKPEI